MLDVLIVIPNLNGEHVLPENLSALPSAAGTLSWQAVLVDNASTDRSVPLVREGFPHVRVIANPENRGFAAACNQGARSLESRHVLLLNSDVTLGPGQLQQLVAYADREPGLGALTPLMCHPDGRLQGPRLGLSGLARGEGVALGFVPGTCLLLRREAFEAVGGLDEAFFFYNEDIDLSWCLRKAGWKLACLRTVRVRHAEGVATRTDPAVRARVLLEGLRGSVLLTRKHHPWAVGPVRLGVRVDLEVQRLRVALKERLGSPLTERERALLSCLAEARSAIDHA